MLNLRAVTLAGARPEHDRSTTGARPQHDRSTTALRSPVPRGGAGLPVVQRQRASPDSIGP